jgi:limonene-1,2-epoxide hydrolase
MGVEQEAIVRQFLTELESHQLDSAQVDRILSYMAPDAKYHVYAWEPPLVGHDAIRADLVRQGPVFTDLRIEILWIASDDQRVFMERLDHMNINAKPVTFHAAGVFEVDANGKIALWRDYFDSKEIETQAGPGVSSAGTRA